MKRLRCVECGMQGSDESAWLWHGKELRLPSGTGRAPRTRVLWLCPDCAGDIGTSEECDAFLENLVGGGAER